MKRLFLVVSALILTSISFVSCEKEREPEKQNTTLPESQRQIDPGTNIPSNI